MKIAAKCQFKAREESLRWWDVYPCVLQKTLKITLDSTGPEFVIDLQGMFLQLVLWKGARARHKLGTCCLWLFISIYCIAVLNFKTFFFPWRRCELSNLLIVCRIYRCFQVSRYQVSWYVNQPRGLTVWCANIPLSVV